MVPILNKHVGDLDWSTACALTQRALPASTISLEPLTARDLRRTLSRMKVRAATGVDAWTVAELHWSLQRLAKALNCVEAGTQCWPQHTLKAWVTLISPLPEKQRPIVLLAMVLKLWPSTRGQQLLRQLSAIVPEALRGGVEARTRKCID